MKKLILFALVHYLKNINKQFANKPLEASVSKIAFIRSLKDVIDKSERGIYKNLEMLEKNKMIKYENKFLKITQRGLSAVKNVENEIKPFIRLRNYFRKNKVKLRKGAQSYFK